MAENLQKTIESFLYKMMPLALARGISISKMEKVIDSLKKSCKEISRRNCMREIT